MWNSACRNGLIIKYGFAVRCGAYCHLCTTHMHHNPRYRVRLGCTRLLERRETHGRVCESVCVLFASLRNALAMGCPSSTTVVSKLPQKYG